MEHRFRSGFRIGVGHVSASVSADGFRMGLKMALGHSDRATRNWPTRCGPDRVVGLRLALHPLAIRTEKTGKPVATSLGTLQERGT